MIINSKELVSLLEKKNTLVTDGRALTKEIEKLETDRNKIGLQIQKLKDKILPLVAKLTDGKLAEFEEITQVENKDGVIEVNIVNVVEDFKRDYLEAKAKQTK